MDEIAGQQHQIESASGRPDGFDDLIEARQRVHALHQLTLSTRKVGVGDLQNPKGYRVQGVDLSSARRMATDHATVAWVVRVVGVSFLTRILEFRV